MSPSRSILIVDDDPDICQILTDLLEHEGYRTQVAANGAEAIAKARQHHYGVVLLDIQLPDLDGLSVLKVFQEIDPELPVIILTAHTTEEKTVGALMKGAFAYLTKPYNQVELKATLRRAVGVKDLAVKAEQAESALSDSEERFRAVAQSAIDAIILADYNGSVISWNKAAQKLFGYTEEEILGEPLTLIMPTRYREAHQKGLDRFRFTGEARVIGKTMELHGLRKDGTEFPLELSLAMWQTQTGMFYSGIIRDITERKQTERRLRESEERLRLALRAADLGIWDWNIRTDEVVWSESVEQFFDLPRGGFAGTYSAFLDRIHPEDRDFVIRAMACALEGEADFDIQHRVVWPDGAVHWLACKGQVLRDETGRAVRMLGTVQDITIRQRVEEA